jgi:hypothetical protein
MTFNDMLRLLENDVRRSEVDDASVEPGGESVRDEHTLNTKTAHRYLEQSDAMRTVAKGTDMLVCSCDLVVARPTRLVRWR